MRLQKINKKERKYQASYEDPRNKALGIRYGDRQLKVVSANIDDIRRQIILKEIDFMMARSKVDIVCIQETHATTSTDQKTQNYRYISSATQPITGKVNEKGIGGGVAIVVKKEWSCNIVDITRYSRRCIKIKLRTNMDTKTLHLINTYAPHMFYRRKERDTYWQEIKYMIGQIPKNLRNPIF